jgi:hypothetical protein
MDPTEVVIIVGTIMDPAEVVISVGDRWDHLLL